MEPQAALTVFVRRLIAVQAMSGWRTLQVDEGSEVPAGRGGAACTAIGGRRFLCFGGANREPLAFDDWWLLELGPDGQGHWTRVSPVLKLSRKRKVLPRSGASITYVPGTGGGPGRVFLFGGQEPTSGAIYDDLLCLDTSSWELSDVALEQPQEQQQQQQQQRRPPGRHSHVAGLYEGRGLIIFGGAGLRGPLADVWTFQPSSGGAADDSASAPSGSWRCLSGDLADDQGPERREMAAGCMISEAGLLVHGGRGADGGLLSDILIFDGRAGRWVLAQDTGVPRCAHTACNAAVQQQAGQQRPATSGGQGDESGSGGPQPADSSGGGRGGGGGSSAAPGAGNVLLFGGFDGEGVAQDLLQLTFRREQRGAGSRSLRAELRPVKAAAEGAPAPRFAHAAAVLPSSDGASAEVVVWGGVNELDDLSDVHTYSL